MRTNQLKKNPSIQQTGSNVERLYKPEEVAEILKVHTRTAQDIFRGEPGVVRLGNSRPGRRVKSMIRIPESVLLRVIEERKVKC